MRDSRDDWEELTGFIFQTPVRAKRPPRAGHAPQARTEALASLMRVARRAPEVMVKVTGSARGFKSLKEHLAYITRNGRLAAERENGDRVEGRGDVAGVAKHWWAESQRGRPSQRARDTINLILSMPPRTDRDAVAEAAREFASETFAGRFDYLIAIHEDTDHPHAHVTIKTRGFDGRRLDPRKADLQVWRETFAQALRRHGVEASATPRRSRGVVRKGIRQAVKHIEARGRSKVSLWKAEHAVRVAHGDIEAPATPWQPKTQERQRKIRLAWATIAQIFDANGDVALALQVKQLLAGMPSVETERELMLFKARKLLAMKHEQARERGRTR